LGLAYVVLAHKLPEQVGRLVRRLEHPDDRILVHVDAKQDIRPFERELEPLVASGRVEWVEPRHRCDWAGPGHLMATLAAADQALSSGHDFSHLILLTGQDYPIRSTEQIRSFFARQPDKSFLSWSLGEGHELPDEERPGNERWHWNGSQDRIVKRHYKLPGRKRPLALPNRFMPFPPRRRPLENLVATQGLAYWNLSRDAIAYCLDYARRHPETGTYMRRSLAPDENFFQMVLLSSDLAPRLVNEDLRYLNWRGWHPRTVTVDDIEPMLASRKLFARKFDSCADREVMDALDAHAKSLAAA
jgi:Core-2/I-Branching enzyme